jgi:acyl transferase domain-containing protein
LKAVVAGANLFYNPDLMMPSVAMRFHSPDSKCYSFDHRANGYARGEGFGSLIIKRLSKAIRDVDTIRAVVRGTGINQDGRTPGITLPSRAAQETLIRDTYKKAGLDLAQTRYFEAHGTGTAAGDPIEAGAIAGAFLKARTSNDGEPLIVGAIKTNIGHLEGTSGLAGLIKTIFVLEKGIVVTSRDGRREPKLGLRRSPRDGHLHVAVTFSDLRHATSNSRITTTT